MFGSSLTYVYVRTVGRLYPSGKTDDRRPEELAVDARDITIPWLTRPAPKTYGPGTSVLSVPGTGTVLGYRGYVRLGEQLRTYLHWYRTVFMVSLQIEKSK